MRIANWFGAIALLFAACSDPAPVGDTGGVDATAEVDTGAADGVNGDSSADTAPDAPLDAAPDVAEDSGPDTSPEVVADTTGDAAEDVVADATPDAMDAASEVGDASSDGAGLDTSNDIPTAGDGAADGLADVVPDTTADATPDVGPDTAADTSSAPFFPWTPSPGAAPSDFFDNAPACSNTDWLAKYAAYRTRLRGDGTKLNPGFLTVGAAPGESIPASMRDPSTNCTTDWWINDASCPITDPADANGKFYYGDSTIHLGYYIAALASEYAVAVKLGIDPAETANDLYYALQAVNRLDEVAETYFGAAPAQNGFFIRVDTPSDFTILADGSYRFPHQDAQYAGYACIESGAACGTQTTEGGYFTSQDQTIGLLFGLAMVKQLVDDAITVQGVGLRQEGRGIAHRIVMGLRDHGWKVVDPNGVSPPDAWGGNAIGYSDQMAKSANFICGTDFGVDDYRDTASMTLGAAAFTGLDLSWAAQINHNKHMALQLVSMTVQWDAAKVATRSLDMAALVFPLAQAVLQQAPISPDFPLWQIEEALTTAPCTGPCNLTPGCGDVPGWRGDNRWQNPAHANGYLHRPVGEYHGLDYMLAHNLYLLLKDGAYALETPAPPTSGCSKTTGLEALLVSAPAGATYDPSDPCNLADMTKTYCGRTFSSWLAGAYAGETTIHTGTARWSCSGETPCTLVVDGAPGGAGVDLMLGTAGVDVFDGGDGDDCLYGFDGADELEGGQGSDVIYGGNGDNEMWGDGRELIVLTGDPDWIYGGPGNDTVDAGPGHDAIYGFGGDDNLSGGAGEDSIYAGEGNDICDGGGDVDIIYGGPGDDEIKGGAGDDSLHGEAGRNKLDGEAGADGLLGGNEDDFLKGGDGDDTLWGGGGNDILCGNAGDDALNAQWGTDGCRGGWGTDTETECENSLGLSECNGSAFNDW